jgi:hypothetical protein
MHSAHLYQTLANLYLYITLVIQFKRLFYIIIYVVDVAMVHVHFMTTTGPVFGLLRCHCRVFCTFQKSFTSSTAIMINGSNSAALSEQSKSNDLVCHPAATLPPLYTVVRQWKEEDNFPMQISLTHFDNRDSLIEHLLMRSKHLSVYDSYMVDDEWGMETVAVNDHGIYEFLNPIDHPDLFSDVFDVGDHDVATSPPRTSSGAT